MPIKILDFFFRSVKIQGDFYGFDTAGSEHDNLIALPPTIVKEMGLNSKTTFVINK